MAMYDIKSYLSVSYISMGEKTKVETSLEIEGVLIYKTTVYLYQNMSDDCKGS